MKQSRMWQQCESHQKQYGTDTRREAVNEDKGVKFKGVAEDFQIDFKEIQGNFR